MNHRTLLLLGAVGAAAAVAAWTRARGEPAASVAHAEDLVTVSVARVERQDLAQGLKLTAELIPFQEVEVMAKVAGYVQRVYVDVGDRVRQGQVLAVLEVPEMRDDITRAGAAIQRNRADLARVQDEVKRAVSAYEMAHLTYTRLSTVAEKQPGLVAQQEIDNAQSRDLMAAAQLAAIRSALSAAQEQINVSEAEQNKTKTLMDYTRVVAPFDGVVTKRYANDGSMLQAGIASQTQTMPVVRLSQNRLLRLVLPVPESNAGAVKPGSPVQVRLPSLDRTFPGTVARIADKVEFSTRTMSAEVDVPNPDLSLIPGMYAEVSITLRQSAGALSVPITALDTEGEAHRVMVVASDGRLTSRKVSIGIETAERAEVTAGLQDGELVVLSRRSQLREGQVVKPKPVPEPSPGGKA
jgi:RND family efflux transporter MFP subunit